MKTILERMRDAVESSGGVPLNLLSQAVRACKPPRTRKASRAEKPAPVSARVRYLRRREAILRGRVTTYRSKIARAEYLQTNAPTCDEALMYFTPVAVSNLRTTLAHFEGAHADAAKALARQIAAGDGPGVSHSRLRRSFTSRRKPLRT